jgi:putative membrane protein
MLVTHVTLERPMKRQLCRLSLAGAALAAAIGAAPAVAAEATIRDAEILHVLHTANVGEIDAAKLAQSKASSADVKKFAQEMIDDHTKMDQEGDTLASKLGLSPSDNEISKKLKADSEATMAKLKDLSGAAFDKAYAEAEVKDHEAVLATIDNTLLPSSPTAELKTMLTNVRPKIQAHLDHAKKLKDATNAAH